MSAIVYCFLNWSYTYFTHIVQIHWFRFTRDRKEKKTRQFLTSNNWYIWVESRNQEVVIYIFISGEPYQYFYYTINERFRFHVKKECSLKSKNVTHVKWRILGKRSNRKHIKSCGLKKEEKSESVLYSLVQSRKKNNKKTGYFLTRKLYIINVLDEHGSLETWLQKM